VYLPMVEHDDHRVIDALPQASESGEHTPRRILLVDDDDAVRTVTAMMLESFGHQVIQAPSGVSAMAELSSEIQLVVTDYAMPGMTGGELAAMVAEVFPTLPVMFITGYADTDVLGLQRAVVVQKPFTESELKQKIMQALAGKSEKAVS
jgi:CheY-like chemotaxis protein